MSIRGRFLMLCGLFAVLWGCGGSSNRPLTSAERAAVDRYVASANLFDEPIRRCAAERAVARVDASQLTALSSASDIELWYSSYAKCVDLDAILTSVIVGPARPDEVQRRCVVGEQPLKGDVEGIVKARLAGREAPPLTEGARGRLAEAYAKCLTAEQRQLLGQ